MNPEHLCPPGHAPLCLARPAWFLYVAACTFRLGKKLIGIARGWFLGMGGINPRVGLEGIGGE